MAGHVAAAGRGPVSPDGLYARLAGRAWVRARVPGCGAAWRRGDEVFAEVALPEAAGGPAGFGLHPALLDAALHAGGAGGPQEKGRGCRSSGAGYRWRPRAPGGRVQITPAGQGDGLRLVLADRPGRRSRWVRSLPVRLSARCAGAAGDGLRDALFSTGWVPVALAGRSRPGRRLLRSWVMTYSAWQRGLVPLLPGPGGPGAGHRCGRGSRRRRCWPACGPVPVTGT